VAGGLPPAARLLASRVGPHGAAAVVALDGDDLAPALAGLHPAERACAVAMTPSRQRDWIAGRLALRAALAQAGLAVDAPVLADPRGAPALPAGVLGSISHKQGAAAALAGAGDGWRVGVDLERWQPPRADLSSRVLTADERAALAHLEGPARGLAVLLRFSLKEAIYKAVDPFVRRYVGFREVEVWPGDDGEARVTVPDRAALPPALEARWERVGEWLVCTAVARP
jgi:4'-phosphopantetheinyl transferase EntD